MDLTRTHAWLSLRAARLNKGYVKSVTHAEEASLAPIFPPVGYGLVLAISTVVLVDSGQKLYGM